MKANAEYLQSVGTHVLMGRSIGLQDTPTTRTVAVVNQAFAKKLFKPGENPVGHYFGTGADSAGDYEVVGVVEDTAYTDARWKDHAMFFVPMLQRPESDKGSIEDDEMLYAGAIVLHTVHPMNDMESEARGVLSGISPNLGIVNFQTFDTQIADRFTEDRVLARLTLEYWPCCWRPSESTG